MTTGEKKHAQQ
uniref:Uncharacterized protein n=1 Tax=Anguilla anguilla TaxID=7936 RepID=A0A0E9R587_ANGAN